MMITEILYYYSHEILSKFKYSSSERCLPEARLVQFRDATISKADETTVSCSLYPLVSRKDLTSSSEWIASLSLEEVVRNQKIHHQALLPPMNVGLN